MLSVHVVQYSHKHGVDVGVYATRELALKNAAFIMLEWWDDLVDADAKVALTVFGALTSHNYEKAFRLWNGAMLEYETMTIEEYIVSPQSEDDNISKTLEGMLKQVQPKSIEAK